MTVSRWAEHGACKGKTALFFPEPGDTKSAARAFEICATCPVLEQCREHVMTNEERYGIWGGMNGVRRRIARNPDSQAAWNQHGTAKAYNYGCRCFDCKEAGREYQIRMRTGRKRNVTANTDTGNTTN